MFLVAWWLTGVFLGWIIWAFYRVWRRERWSRGLSAGPTAILCAITKAVIGAVKIALAKLWPPRIQPQNDSDNLRRPPVAATGWRLTRAVILTLLVIVFAAATDQAQLMQYMLVLKSYLVGIRVQALIVGILSGIAFRQYQWPLRRFAHRLGKAVIGDKENTAWALQSAVAIGLIAVGLFAVRPDLLQYLRSFKFGTLEATFADRGPLSLRDARLNLTDFRAKLSVDQYKNFRDQFLSPTSERGLARRLLTGSQGAFLQKEGAGEKIDQEADETTFQHDTGEITALLFDHYVDPVLSSILCLEKVHSLPVAIHDPDLSAYAGAWKGFLLQVHRDSSFVRADSLRWFLAALRDRSAPLLTVRIA